MASDQPLYYYAAVGKGNLAGPIAGPYESPEAAREIVDLAVDELADRMQAPWLRALERGVMESDVPLRTPLGVLEPPERTAYAPQANRGGGGRKPDRSRGK